MLIEGRLETIRLNFKWKVTYERTETNVIHFKWRSV